jgi:hypothetical protein
MRLAVLTWAVAILFCYSATAQIWSIGDTPLPIPISHLSATRQQLVRRALEPAIQGRAHEFDLSPEEIAEAKWDLHVKEVVTAGGKLLLIQGWGMQLCGATGNCAVWALDEKNRLILETSGNGIRLLRTIHHRRPSILMYEHMSAFQTGLTWYSYDGSRYRPVSCGVETYGDTARPSIERGPCRK